MVILYTLLSILLIVAGGVGLFVTLTGSEVGTVVWMQGAITFGVFLLIGLVIIIGLLTFLVEHD